MHIHTRFEMFKNSELYFRKLSVKDAFKRKELHYGKGINKQAAAVGLAFFAALFGAGNPDLPVIYGT